MLVHNLIDKNISIQLSETVVFQTILFSQSTQFSSI